MVKIYTISGSSAFNHHCSICMNAFNLTTQKAMCLIPCGHSFCIVCVEKLTKCPNCREGFIGRTINLTILDKVTIEQRIHNNRYVFKNRYDKLFEWNKSLCMSVVKLLQMIFTLVSFIFFVTSIIFFNECTKNALIPTWFMVDSICGLILIGLIKYALDQNWLKSDSVKKSSSLLKAIGVCIFAFVSLNFWWLIAGGALWLYMFESAASANLDPNFYCNSSLVKNLFFYRLITSFGALLSLLVYALSMLYLSNLDVFIK